MPSFVIKGSKVTRLFSRWNSNSYIALCIPAGDFSVEYESDPLNDDNIDLMTTTTRYCILSPVSHFAQEIPLE